MTSRKQRFIMDCARRWGCITLDQATSLVGSDIYHNARKHTGALLSNMVRRGMLERVKPGVFRVAERKGGFAMRWVDGEELDCESPDGVWYGVEECADSEYNGL